MLDSKVFKKIIIWRISVVIISIFILYLFTGELLKSTIISIVDHTVCMIYHYFFEKYWDTLCTSSQNNDVLDVPQTPEIEEPQSIMISVV